MEKADTIYGRFIEQVRRRPDALAARDEHRSVSFSELDALAMTVSSMLPEGASRVGVVMDHCVEQIAAIYGILGTGAAYVPAEPSFPDDRISFMMEDASVDCVVTESRYARRFRGVPVVVVDPGMAISDRRARPYPGTEAGSLAYVLYTSGSTGRPKGVAVENCNVLAYVDAYDAEFRVSDEDVELQYSVCSFDIFVEEVFASLLNGASLAIPSAETKKDLRRTMEFADRCGVTIVTGFPYLLLEMNSLEKLPSRIRLLISGGDVLRARYVDRLVGRYEVYNTYGPSETTVCATYFRCNGAEPLADGTYPVGKAIKGYRVDVLDDSLSPVGPGKTGEICIRGNGVSRGYINNADRQRLSFVETADGDVVYRTGDLGYVLPDGNIAFLHRKDNQVMILGRRVEPDGVESVLCSCSDVKQGIVRSYIDENDLAYLVAYYVRNGEVSVDEIRAEMAKKLPEYMMPEFFVELNFIPLTPNGKVDNKALPVVRKLVEP